MDTPTLISLTLNAVGTIISISGSIYNAMGFHKFALFLWLVSNGVLMALFLGVAMGWFVLNGGAWLQVGLYVIFIGTSSYGYWRISNDKV